MLNNTESLGILSPPLTPQPTSTISTIANGSGLLNHALYGALLNKMQSITTFDVATLAYPCISFLASSASFSCVIDS